MSRKPQEPNQGDGSEDTPEEFSGLEVHMPDFGDTRDVFPDEQQGANKQTPKKVAKEGSKQTPKTPSKPRSSMGTYVPPSEDAQARLRSLVESAGLADEFDQLVGSSGTATGKHLKSGGNTPSEKEIEQAVAYLRTKQAEASGDEWIHEDANYFEYIDEDAYYFSERETPSIRIGTSAKEGPKAILFGAALAGIVFILIPITQFMAATPKGQEEVAQQTFVIPPPDVPPPEKPPPPPPPPKEELDEEPPEPPKLSLANIELSLNIGTGGELSGDFGMPGLDLSQESLGSVDIFDLADLDAPPRVLVQTPPSYPGTMRMAKIEGRVFLRFIVDETGRVIEPRVAQAPHEDLGRAAVEAVLKWRFEPPLKDGRPVKARMGIGIPFTL